METEPIAYETIPLKALSAETISSLSLYLNAEKVLSFGSFSGDWRGIAKDLKLSVNHINLIDQAEDKCQKLISFWIESNVAAHFAKLFRCLEVIGRFDVLDDLNSAFERDARAYLTRLLQPQSLASRPIIKAKPENHIITVQDTAEGIPQLFDAFVLCDANNQVHNQDMLSIIQKLEQKGFSICIKERDFLGGIDMEHEAVLEMIAERCFRVLVFVTQSLIDSQISMYIAKFCQRESIDNRCRKIIPILMEPVRLPLSLKNFTSFKFYKQNPFTDFYAVLESSLKRAV